MSDVDDSKLRTLQDNTSNMIELQLSRIKSKNDSLELGVAPASPSKRSRAGNEDQEEKKSSNSDEEFYDCFDNQEDIRKLEQNMSIAAGPSGGMSRAPIRRTASFHYIEKIDEEKEEEDEEEKDEVSSMRPANL